MWMVSTPEEMQSLEKERALVGVFVDRSYNKDRIDWLLEARLGFNEHSRDAWHLLIPVTGGYGVDVHVDASQYGLQLAGGLINKLEIDFASLPCIVFRAANEDFYYLKLGGKSREQFFEEIGRIADLAINCQKTGPADPAAYREYVNGCLIVHLRKRRILSAAASALPAISGIIGSVVGAADLF